MIFQLEIVGKKIQNIDDFGSNRKENPINGYKIIDANILQGIFSFCSKYLHYAGEKSLYLSEKDKSRRGLSKKLSAHIRKKQALKTFYFSNTTNEKLIYINLRSIYTATSAGGGLTLLKVTCSSMNLPPPVHSTPYSKYLKVFLKSAIDNYEESMKHAAPGIAKIGASPTEIVAGCDGTCQKRYEHKSLLGLLSSF